MSREHPPRLARRVLERALPSDVRSDVLGDLTEVFRQRCESRGVLRARLWYWAEAVSFSSRFLWERIREGGFLGAQMSLLDFKLGIRMLFKYPGLTLVGGMAMSVGIAITAGFFEFSKNLISPELPFEDGERIVSLLNWDQTTGSPEFHALHDLQIWRDELESVEEIGVYRSFARNLITDDGLPTHVRGAAMSASSFRIARVPPLLGRYLTDGDEEPGAPPVIVLGYDLWRARFGADPTIVGRDVRLGATTVTVVGVMPSGFGFPVNQTAWIPLQLDPLLHARLEGPSIRVFGRLRDGVSLLEAQAEFSTIGERTSRDFPATNGSLRTRVSPYAQPADGDMAWSFRIARFLVVLVLLIACANVGILVFARSATREREMAVRSALGASRSRIVLQLFVESLVLATGATAVGLAFANWAVGIIFAQLRNSGLPIPFWWPDQLAWGTVAYALLFTLLAAGVAGVLPALKVTGRGRPAGLGLVAAGGSRLSFGSVSTTVIITQVAVSVGLLTMAIGQVPWFVSRQAVTIDIPAEEYLTARLRMDTEASPTKPRFWSVQEELERRLSAEPRVRGVTRVSVLPGVDHPDRFIEVEDSPVQPSSPDGHVVQVASVDVDFFDVMSAPVLTGRRFDLADVDAADGPDARVVLVNQSFVRTLLGDQNAIGRRLRYTTTGKEESGPWHEIIGVVRDLGMSPGDPSKDAGLYHPLTETSGGFLLAVHVGENAIGFAPRLRSIAFAVDPTLGLVGLATLDEVMRTFQLSMQLGALAIVLITSAALVLSLAGIYSLMSFIVSQRTREIGIRAALGARPGGIVKAILTRAAMQLGTGVVCGIALTFMFNFGGARDGGVVQLLSVSALMTGMGLIACAMPARRALRIEPTEALRAEQ